jgi:hypothetical protein
MPRWDIFDPSRGHSSELRTAADQPRTQSRSTAQRPLEVSSERPRESRAKYEDRGRIHSLRSSEMAAMIDIGRFRAVDIQDLNRFAYRGDQLRMKQDLENLREQGLVQEKTVFRAHKSARRIVTLTKQGRRLVREKGGLPREQRIYHGFVKRRELDHDADLYKVYQKAVERLHEKGCNPTRVWLDFELKESINRAKESAKRLSREERETLLQAVAQEHGLTAKGVTIHLPDMQIEYETTDGRMERENLELLSRNYREDAIRSKAAAGFTIYARTGDTHRIRRALQDTGLVREVLSI